ncbi:hypothetical protein VP424E501_P0134 [Vibrio phage 424E50-1]|nr:hypothetical protein VP424E501_P0134 [Vibrio phage 424E50-1]
MLTANQVLRQCTHWGIIAEYNLLTKNNGSSVAYCKFHALQQVLELPYSRQCKGLTIEELEEYCKEVSKLVYEQGLNLQEHLQRLDLKTFENKLK